MAPSTATARPGHPTEKSGSEQTSTSGLRPDSISVGWIIAVLVLLCTGAFPLYAESHASGTAATLQLTLLDASMIGAASTMITQEDLEFQRYRRAPSTAAAARFRTATEAVTTALFDAQNAASAQARTHARRLAGEQSEYLRQVDPLIRAGVDSARMPAEQEATAAAFQVLIQDANGVRLGYTTIALRQAAQVRGARTEAQVAMVITLALGAGLAGLGAFLELGRRRAEAARAATDAAGQVDRDLDPLTQLPDPTGFASHLRAALDEARGTAGRGLTVLAICLDGFEQTVDAFGDDGGDQLLVAASRRLRRVVRDVDTVARLSDSSFGALLHDMVNRLDVQAVTGRIEQVLNRDFRLQGGSAAVRACVGIAIGPPDSDPDELVLRARTAMDTARTAGGGVRFFDALNSG